MLKETVLNHSFFNYLIIYISVIDGNVICLVYTPIKTILFNINYSCTYRNYSPSSDNFYNYLNVIGRLSSLTQRYCSCSCPWPGRTAAGRGRSSCWRSSLSATLNSMIGWLLHLALQPLDRDLAELLTRRVKYTAGAGCRRQQQASGCRGRLQPGLAVDGNYYLNIDILLYPTGAGIQSAQSKVQSPETAAPRCCPRLTDVIVTRGTDF